MRDTIPFGANEWLNRRKALEMQIENETMQDMAAANLENNQRNVNNPTTSEYSGRIDWANSVYDIVSDSEASRAAEGSVSRNRPYEQTIAGRAFDNHFVSKAQDVLDKAKTPEWFGYYGDTQIQNSKGIIKEDKKKDTQIYKRTKADKPLSSEEIEFLYNKYKKEGDRNE